MVLLTIFTPTYNRSHTITRTYGSLKAQNCKEFIWLIVDDGSTDNTECLVRQWQKENCGFEIRYVYKDNGGMHTAHNIAYENIDTELNMCIDSDDCVADGAVKKILDKWKEIKNEDYAGIIGLDSDMNGQIIGKGFPKNLVDTTLSVYYANGGSGDKKLVYRTDIINKYPPYPVFEGERYVALGYKYRLIDQEYKLSVLNQVLANVDYQQDGSSATMWKQYVKNPKGFAFWRKVSMQYPESKKRLLVDCTHYVSNSLMAGNRHFITESPRKGLTIMSIPSGIVLYFITKYKARKN